MQQETKGEATNRIEEAYRKQAFLMPSLSISATTPSVNRAMVIAEVRIGEHSPNLAQAANSKPQRPKLISQACGIKLPYPLGLLKETTASGFERPFRYICAWQTIPTAKHTTSNFALRVNQSFTLENPVFSAVDSLSNPKITSRCFQRKPGTYPFPTTESLLPLKVIYLEFQILLPTKRLTATRKTAFAKHTAGT